MVKYVGRVDMCNECHAVGKLVDHHIQYEPEEIIKVLCKSCHIKFHKKNPDVRVPESFNRNKSEAHNAKWTTVGITQQTRKALKEHANEIGIGMTMSWNDLFLKLIEESKNYRDLAKRYRIKVI